MSLNALNQKYKTSSILKTVPIMKLIRVHNPKSHRELNDLINSHNKPQSCCNIRSKGTINDFGKNLYNCQKIEWGEYKYSIDECIQWMYKLFIENSLKGRLCEDIAMELLRDSLLGDLKIEKSSDKVDSMFGVDIVIKDIINESILCGIQVKPETYKYVQSSIKKYNKELNKKWKHPVFYLYYDKSQNFLNMDKIIENIVR